MTKTKNYNIEILRALSCALVIVIHVSNYYCRGFGRVTDGEFIFSVIMDTFARLSVPCFFMVSGALLLGREEDLTHHSARIKKFFVILIFWNLVYYLHNMLYMGTEEHLWKLIFEPMEAHLWYLYAMIPIYLVLPFFQIMFRGMNVKLDRAFMALSLAAIFIMYFSSLLQEKLYFDIPLIGDRSYAVYFVAGFMVKKYQKRIQKPQWMFLMLFLIANMANVIGTVMMSYRTGDFYERFLEYGNPVLFGGSVAFFIWIMQMQNGRVTLPEKVKRFMDVFGPCTLGIYLIHILFLDNFKKYVAVTDFSAWSAVPAVVAFLLLLSFGCVYVVRKIPYLRKVV
ncbi:MAG: acyltransferase family protein [Hespellia sp.]|nr:acyltransferase family protein [Hespellia sp.]